jgi:hypothetical protein
MSSRLLTTYTTIILPSALYGRETWSLTLREEYGLRVYENRVQRGIFGPKGKEVVGGWRRLHNDELRNLYTSPNIRVMKSGMRWVAHVARMEEMRGVDGKII